MTESLLPLAAIIVLTWNQRDLTLDCLTSLAKMTYPADRLDVIVVDNGSADGTAETIRERFPQVTVLENAENLGFAEGNNVGIRYAMKHSADYVMLLNNDTVVDPEMLTRLIQVGEAYPASGIITPKIYYYGERDRIWCAGASIDWRTGSTKRLQADQLDTEQESEPYRVDFASGCAICLKREVIEKIGLLDPRFFIYYEETDWCVRASKAGWQIIYVPTSYVWHKVSAAMGTASPATDYYMNRNVLLFLTKNQTGWRRWIPLMRVITRNLLTILAYTLKSHYGKRTSNRNVRVLAFRDALLAHWGKMGPDVAAICYPKRK
jgi:hypothetical protein